MTTNKGRPLRSHDLPAPVTAGGGSIIETASAEQQPARPTITRPPQALTLKAKGLLRSAVTPTAYIDIEWRPPPSVEPEKYEIEWSESSSFTNAARMVSTRATVRLEVKTAQAYYIRVRAIVRTIYSPWTGALSVTTDSDNTPPDPPSGLAAVFLDDGALEIRATNPNSPNFYCLEAKIYNGAGKAVEYDRIEFTAGKVEWSAARNKAQTVGSPDASPDPAVYIEVRARSWGNAYSTAINTTATRARPANVTGVSVNFTGPAAELTWAAVAGAVKYLITLTGDGGAKTYESVAPRFSYSRERNIADHGGDGDPTLTYSIVAVDALGQQSVTPATGSATNAAPGACAITLAAGFSTIAAQLTLPTASDLAYIRVRFYRDGGLVATYNTQASIVTHSATATGSGSYTADTTAYDIYGQAGTVTTSAAVNLDVLTLAELRSGATYSDSVSTAAATLKAQLADNVRSSGGITYALGTAYKWTEIKRELTDRYQPLLITATAGQGYAAVSSDQGATWMWFAGPLAADGRTLTSVASEAAAQAAPVTLPTATDGRLDLPGIREGQQVRLYHRNTAANYTIREFYAERVIEGDLIRAGTVRTLHLAADSVTADKISVTQLSAISADMGTLTAGTITGATIRTAASGQRIELTSASGLRGINSSNVVQVQISPTTGALTTGGGTVTLDNTGLAITVGTGTGNAVSFMSGTTPRGSIRGYLSGADSIVSLAARDNTGSIAGSVNVSSAGWFEVTGGPGLNSSLFSHNGSTFYVTEGDIIAETGHFKTLNAGGGLALGGATPIAGAVAVRGSVCGIFWQDRTLTTPQWGWYSSAGTARLWLGGLGDIIIADSSGHVGIGIAPTNGVALRVAGGSSTATGTYGLVVQNDAGTINNFWTRDDGAGFLRAGAWTFSDRNAKKNIRGLEKGLATLERLSGYRYDYTDGMAEQIGMLAQEVKEELPELVMELPDGMGLALNYQGLIPVLLNAIKELGGRVKALEARGPGRP